MQLAADHPGVLNDGALKGFHAELELVVVKVVFGICGHDSSFLDNLPPYLATAASSIRHGSSQLWRARSPYISTRRSCTSSRSVRPVLIALCMLSVSRLSDRAPLITHSPSTNFFSM